jgi:hypothetical protein
MLWAVFSLGMLEGGSAGSILAGFFWQDKDGNR